MELCACPECGSPAEVIDAECLTVAAALMDSASTGWSTPYRGPAPVALGESSARPGRPEMVGVRCIRRHWFLGTRDRLVG